MKFYKKLIISFLAPQGKRERRKAAFPLALQIYLFLSIYKSVIKNIIAIHRVLFQQL